MATHKPTLTQNPPTPQIAWTCAYCRAPIIDGDGSLYVTASEVTEAQDAAARHEARRRRLDAAGQIPSLGDLPFILPAGWKVAHIPCDPDPDGWLYAIDLHEARTPWQLLRWTAHVMPKTWARHTNWLHMIGTIARQGVR